MNPAIEAAKAEYNRAKSGLEKAFENTPDDKINWSPSASSRTPVALVAHSALSVEGIQGWFEGKPFAFASMAEMDDFCRDQEKEFSSRKQVTELLELKSANYLAYLDSLSPEQVASDFVSAMGTFPMAAAITFPADHMRQHKAQLEYIQTIYGDRDMHM